jgi:hypothetical protein
MRRFLFLFLALALCTGKIAAAEVSGRYLDNGSTDIRLLLTIQPPAPAAFIVTHRVPGGTQLLAAAPAPVSEAGPVVKWLFKRPRPGSILVRMHFSQPVAASRLQGTISYRHPENGAVVLTRIKE